MDMMLNNSSRARLNSDPFRVPPNRESTHHGSVYESIDDYQTQAQAEKNKKLSWQQQDHEWKLQQRELDSERKSLEDSTYQVMNSATGGMVDEYNFQPYPSARSPNHHNPTEMPQGAESIALDNSYPFAFQVGQPCPAAAGSSSSIHDLHDDPNILVYHPSCGDHLLTVIEVPDNGDDQEDYTFMSQAGTLSSQNDRTGSYSYNSSSKVEHPKVPMHSNTSSSKVSEC